MSGPLTTAIQGLISSANQSTGWADTTLTDAVNRLKAGYTGEKIKRGGVRFTQTYNSTTNVQIATVADIGFTPSRFFMYIDPLSSVSGKQYAMLYSSFETYGTPAWNIRMGARYTNTSGGVGAWVSLSSWTSQTSGQLYLSDGKIYFRAGSSYILNSNTVYNWIAYA